MLLALTGALAAAACYGAGSVLQGVSAGRTTTAKGLDPRLVLRLLAEGPYLLGLTLDGVGFVLSVVALQTLPLFVVQAVVASSLAFTAVIAAFALRVALSRADVVSVVAVSAGLTTLAAAAGRQPAPTVGPHLQWTVLAAAFVVAALAAVVARRRTDRGAAVLGGLAGLSFGVVAIAARILPLRSLEGATSLLRNPATYALLVAAGVALVAYAAALQRGSVLAATAPLVVAETLVPALLGVTLLGDRARPGWGWPAAAGFVLAVGGAVALSRHGEVTPSDATR